MGRVSRSQTLKDDVAGFAFGKPEAPNGFLCETLIGLAYLCSQSEP